MEIFNYTNLVIFGFLALTLIIGLWAGRKIKTIEDYAIANRSYGVGILTMTFLATYIGGSNILSIPFATFHDGIIQSVLGIGAIMSFLFMAKFVAPHMHKFKKSLTVGHIAFSIYGKTARIFVALTGLIFSLCIVGGQILAIGKILMLTININSQYAIIFGGIIIILYSSFGGIRSVAITDVLQFVALIFVISIVANKMLFEVGGIKKLFKDVYLLHPEKFKIFSHPKISYYVVLFFVWCFFPSFMISPPFVQRLLMTKNSQQIRKVFYGSSIIYLIFRILITIIGFGAVILFPNINSKIIIPEIIEKYFSFKMQAFLIVGLLSVVMSTADSFLNAAGLLVSHDLIKPFFKNKTVEKNSVTLVKLITVIVGVLSIIFALYGNNISKMVFTASCIMSSITIPIIAGIMGLKPTKKSFFGAILASIITFATIYIISPENGNIAVLVSIFVNAIVFFSFNYIENDGFIIIKSHDHKEEKLWKPSWNDNLIKPIKNFSKKVSKDSYKLFSFLSIIFLIVLTIPNFFVKYYDFYQTYSIIRFIGIFLITFGITKELWPKYLKNYFLSFFLVFNIIYCFSFYFNFCFLLGINNIYMKITYLFIASYLAFFVDIKSFILLKFIGICICMLIFKFKGYVPIYENILELTLYIFLILIIIKLFKIKVHKRLFALFFDKHIKSPVGRTRGLSWVAKKKAFEAAKMYDSGNYLCTEICKKLNISRPTFYRYIEYAKLNNRSN